MTTSASGQRCEVCGEEKRLRVATYNGVLFSYSCRCEYEERMQVFSSRENEEQKLLVAKLFREARIPKRYEGCSLESFEVTDGNRVAYRAVSEYVKNLGENVKNGQGLVLYGPAGTGKTHLAVAILRRATGLGYSALFQNAPELMYRFNATYTTGDTEEELIRVLRNVHVLVLDDLGKGKWTEKVEERIYVVINARYSEMHPTIVTTNLEPAKLLEFVGQAVFDRLREVSTFVGVGGESYRKKVVTRGKGGAVQATRKTEVCGEDEQRGV